VTLDPSGTDYIDYSNNAIYFHDAHGINPNDENTTSLIMQKNDAPFYLSTLDDFTICVKYKVHDDLSSNAFLGQHFISPVYDLSFSTTQADIGDTVTITVTKGSNDQTVYNIEGDFTSSNLGNVDMSGILTEVETILQYTIQSGSGKLAFVLQNTDVSGTVNVSKTIWVTVQTNVLGEKVFAFSESGPSGPFYNQKNVSFTAGDLVRFDVSDSSNNDFVLDFGSTVDAVSDDGTYLSSDAAVNIVSDGGNKYVFNNGSTYESSLSYKLSTGTYIIRNVPSDHLIAVLNSGNTANITYGVLDESPIVIKVSGGSFSSPYYNFTDEDDNSIDIAGGVFYFMRGRTYQFVANGISGTHPFKVHSDNGDTSTLTGSGGSFNVTIQTTQSLVAGDLYYICGNHGGMKANMSVINRSVTSTTADATYDFYYGDVQINVLGDFGTVSVYCYYHGYMGGENMFTYSAVPDISSYISRTGTPGQSNSMVIINVPNSYSGDALHYFEDSSANMGLDQIYYNMTLPNNDLRYNGTTWTNTLGHSQFDISVNLSASAMPSSSNNTIQNVFTNTAGSFVTESVVLGSSAYYKVNPVGYSGTTVTAASSQTISGEWIEWEFPYAVRIYSIQLNKDYESVSNASYKTLLSNTFPQLVSLVGSNDGIAWTFIEQVNTGVTASAHSAAGKASAVSNGYNVVEVNNSQYFTYYRMIVESIVNDGGVDIFYGSAMSPRIGEIHLGCDIYTVGAGGSSFSSPNILSDLFASSWSSSNSSTVVNPSNFPDGTYIAELYSEAHITNTDFAALFDYNEITSYRTAAKNANSDGNDPHLYLDITLPFQFVASRFAYRNSLEGDIRNVDSIELYGSIDSTSWDVVATLTNDRTEDDVFQEQTTMQNTNNYSYFQFKFVYNGLTTYSDHGTIEFGGNQAQLGTVFVTVSGSPQVFYLDGVEAPEITFVKYLVYIFDQSDPSNDGEQLVFGYTIDDTTNILTSVDGSQNIIVMGTPGQPGAYTQITFDVAPTSTVYYYSMSGELMGWN
jgi:hypothetical protein